MQIQNIFSPLGVDAALPLFSWQLKGERCGERQTYYRIVLAQDEEQLTTLESVDWDSGKVESSEQLGIMYAGQPLQSVTAYCYKVGVWDQDGHLEWSQPHTLFTGRLDGSQWEGHWMGSGRNKPFYMRSQFRLFKPVNRVFALVSGLGHFKLFMNGAKVGNHEMDPGWTNYHRSVQYVCFDVTDQIRQGENAIGISVGNGFYAGDPGGRHFYTIGKGYEPFGNQLKAFGECHIEYADGSKEIVCTGSGHWKVRDSATTLANVYGSENYDARLYPAGWDDNGFDDADWETALRLESPAGKLVCQNQPPITVKHIYDAVVVEEPRPQVYVFDLGQNMSGMFEIYVSGPAGSKVTVKPGELRNEDGTVATPWDIDTYSEYTLAGTGDIEVWKPDFSCFGARWVQIEGCTRDESAGGTPVIHDVKGHFVTSAARDVGELETDDPRIAKLAQLITKAIESNLQSVHSDCPTIEKLGWLETAHLMGPSVMYVKQAEELWLKITRDMIEAQTEEGLIPDIAPEYSRFEGGFRDSIAWGSAIIIVPDLLLGTYGSRTAIEEAYPAMKAYMSYLKAQETNDRLIGCGLGDWGIEPQTGGDYVENVETAVYYYNFTLMEKFSNLLGLSEDSTYYHGEAERIKRGYNAALLKPVQGQQAYAYCKVSGEYDPDNQVVQAMPLMLGLVPEERRADIEAALLKAASSHQMRSGEIGLRFLFGALSAIGRSDIVLDMMMQPEHPSYIRFVEKGETALPEFWTDDARSRNHDMMGHVLEWMYKHMLGISSQRDAYRDILIAPLYSDRVRHIRGTYQSVRGRIEVDFSHRDDTVRLTVRIPPNTEATVKIPLAVPESQLIANGEEAACAIVNEAGRHYAVTRIGSGSYTFAFLAKQG